MTAAPLETWSSVGSMTRRARAAPRIMQNTSLTPASPAGLLLTTMTVVDVRRRAAMPATDGGVRSVSRRDIRHRRHPAMAGVDGTSSEREQTVGTNDVTSGRQDGPVDETKDREVGAHGHGGTSTVAKAVTGVASNVRTASVRSSEGVFKHGHSRLLVFPESGKVPDSQAIVNAVGPCHVRAVVRRNGTHNLIVKERERDRPRPAS
jgi:hypothetical protein